MASDLDRLLAQAYKMKNSGQNPEAWLRQQIGDNATGREEAVDAIDRMTEIIKRRGAEACHLTSVYRDMLQAALKEEEETNESAGSNRRSSRHRR